MADGDRIPKVLVVDDEPNIRELVEVALKFHGCAVSVSASGKDALHQAEAYEPDLMILDVMLPDMDGFEVCRTLRSEGNDVPVIFLTARDTTSDTIRGLTLGGDDYVTKPFSVEALVARVRAVLRRTTRAPGGDGPGDDAALLTVGDLELDEEHWAVRRNGTAVELSPTEFRLLAYLMRNQGRMLTRQQLLENVWGWEFAGESQVVETYVSYLRRKLDPLGPPLIHTQRGVGYSLRPPPETERAGRSEPDAAARAWPRQAVAAVAVAGRADHGDRPVPHHHGRGHHRGAGQLRAGPVQLRPVADRPDQAERAQQPAGRVRGGLLQRPAGHGAGGGRAAARPAGADGLSRRPGGHPPGLGGLPRAVSARGAVPHRGAQAIRP